jgi:hypothetical protein
MGAVRSVSQPPTDINSEQEEALLPREILDQVGAALRTHYDSEIAAGESRQFEQHLAALDRAEGRMQRH